MTYLLGIIGSHPSKYSKSPKMWNALMAHLGIDGVYEAWDLGDSNLSGLESKLNELRENPDFLGCNVTIPYKQDVIKYVNLIEGDAVKMGTVNTVKKVGSTALHGFCTDGYGAVGCLKEAGIDPKDKTFLITGAGGATPAIAFALAAEGAKKIAVHNRTRETAVELADRIARLTSTKSYGGGLGETEVQDELVRSLKEADVVINTTDLGLSGEKEHMSPLSKEQAALAKKDAAFFDIVYTPHETLFLRQAKELGHKIVYGDGMLLWQAVRAAEIIFDRKLNQEAVKVMRAALSSDD